MLSKHDILEKAHTIAATHPEIESKEVPDFIDGYPQEVWAEMMLKFYENYKPHARGEDFTLSQDEANDLATDEALKWLDEQIEVYLVDGC